MNKKEKQEKFLKLLAEKIGGKGASEKQLGVLNQKFDDVLKLFTDAISTQVITKVAPEVTIKNLEPQLKAVLGEDGPLAQALSQELKGIAEAVQQKPDWYEAPHKAVSVDGPVEIVAKSPLHVKMDIGDLAGILAALFASLMEGLVRLSKRTVRIMPVAESFTTPQYVMLIDPANGMPVRPTDIGKAPIPGMGGTAIAASGGPTAVGARGADSFNDGQQTVVTAGTRVQLGADINCSRVVIQAHPDNTGEVVVGGASVVAATANRRGLMLYGSQWSEFKVSNLTQLYIDSTADGDKVNYFYEA